MQAKKKKIIKVPKGAVQELMEWFDCAKGTIYNALAYRTEGEIPSKIRNTALKVFNGVETEKVVFN